MKKTLLLRQCIVIFFLVIIATLASAAEVKFSIVPILRAPNFIAPNGIALAQYKITNNTPIARELTTIPIAGVHPLNTGLHGSCKSPIFLMPGESCLLTLQIIAPEMSSLGIHSGPEVCGTTGPTHQADPFLCSRPFPTDLFNIDIFGAIIPVTISVAPSDLTFSIANFGILTVSNTSPFAFALNTFAHFLAHTPITLTNTCPIHLAPGASCHIHLSSVTPATTTLSIMGTNTNQLLASITASNMLTSTSSPNSQINLTTSSEIAPIAVSPSLLSMVINGTGTVTVTNLSSSLNASNITPAIPGGTGITITNTTCGDQLPPGESCKITFSSSMRNANGINVTIQGTNTHQPTVKIFTLLATIQVSSPILEMEEEHSASITITNTSHFTATGIRPILSQGITVLTKGNNCLPSLAPSASCTITFQAISASATGFDLSIRGINTNSVPVRINVAEALLKVNPTEISFLANTEGSVTVTNLSLSPALNVQPIIPPGTDISLVTSTCPPSLAAGASCNLTFTGTTAASHPITVSGANTNSPNVIVNIQNMPVLSVTPTSATITADGSTLTQFIVTNTQVANAPSATNVQMHLPTNWTDVTQIRSEGCSNLAVGSSNCSISLSSPTPYVAQGGIVVRGDNTSQTSPTVAIAFIFQDGLVFNISDSSIFVTDLADVSPAAAWQILSTTTHSTSFTDEASNTAAMLQDLPSSPAMTACNNLHEYVPTLSQLEQIFHNLAALNIGHFRQSSYWSSTEASPLTAFSLNFAHGGVTAEDPKNLEHSLRCARTL